MEHTREGAPVKDDTKAERDAAPSLAGLLVPGVRAVEGRDAEPQLAPVAS